MRRRRGGGGGGEEEEEGEEEEGEDRDSVNDRRRILGNRCNFLLVS